MQADLPVPTIDMVCASVSDTRELVSERDKKTNDNDTDYMKFWRKKKSAHTSISPSASQHRLVVARK